MQSFEKLPSKEILRNIAILNQLEEFHHKMQTYYSNHNMSIKQTNTIRGSPLTCLCKYVDGLSEDHVFHMLFGHGKEELRVRISTLVCDLSREAEEEVHRDIYGSFEVIASDFADTLWMRNTRAEYGDGETVARHF
jgi:hypothetical protein